jgi:hypothetical protein
VLLGYKHISSLKQENSSTSVPEERVEISEDEWEVLQVQETDVDDYVMAGADSAGSSTSNNDSSGSTWSMVVGRRKKSTAPTGPRPTNNLMIEKESFAKLSKLTTLQTIRSKTNS